MTDLTPTKMSTIKPTPMGEWTIAGVLLGAFLLATYIVHVLDQISQTPNPSSDIVKWLGMGLIGAIIVLVFGTGIFGTKSCGSISADVFGNKFNLGENAPLDANTHETHIP